MDQHLDKETIESKQREIREETAAAERSDIKTSWVSTSKFVFYLSVVAFVLMTWGGCYKLYTKSYKKIEVPVQESTLYTPKYK